MSKNKCWELHLFFWQVSVPSEIIHEVELSKVLQTGPCNAFISTFAKDYQITTFKSTPLDFSHPPIFLYREDICSEIILHLEFPIFIWALLLQYFFASQVLVITRWSNRHVFALHIWHAVNVVAKGPLSDYPLSKEDFYLMLYKLWSEFSQLPQPSWLPGI